MKDLNRRSSAVSSFILPLSSLFIHILKHLPLLLLLISVPSLRFTFAQHRPELKPVRRDYFAGKFLYIPRDERPSALRQPSMIAAVADHYLITPPVGLLGDSGQIIDWARDLDYGDIDGALISLDALVASPGAGAAQEWHGWQDLIKRIRSRRPGVPVYASLTLSGPSRAIIESAVGLVADGSIDFLLIGNDGKSGDSRQKALLARLESEIGSRKLGDKTSISDDPDTINITLLIKMLNSRFGFAPRILSVYSSKVGPQAPAASDFLPLGRMIGEKIETSGGIEIQQTPEGARNVDLLLFIHSEQTRDAERAAMVGAMAQVIDRNVRVGLVDLSETRESKDAVIKELRRRKILDKLVSYASCDPAIERPGDAATRSLAQALSFLISIRFLRDDRDRIRRFDRAQENLLVSRYLSDWVFPFQIRPKLPTLQSAPAVNGTSKPSDDAVEAFVLNQLKPAAEELFKEQFGRNVHSYLLSNGERTQFEVHMIQRLMLRLFWRSGSPQSVEVEIKPSVYLIPLSEDSAPKMPGRTSWEVQGVLDDRVGRRWDSIDWPLFKTDAESVEMTIKVTAKQDAAPGPQESYTISSKRSRNIRRIQIDADSHRAAFYALGKLERMGSDGQLARDFHLTESQVIDRRGIIESFSAAWWSHRDRQEMLRFLGRLRMNYYYYIPPAVDQGPEPVKRDDEKIRELLRVADENFVQFVYGIRLQGDSRDHGSIESSLDRLVQLGVRRFVICFDNTFDNLQSGNYEEGLKKILSAQSLLISRAREYLKRSGEIELSVWPKSPRSNTGARYMPDYLKRLAAAIPQDVRILALADSAEATQIESSRRINLQTIKQDLSIEHQFDLCLGARPADLSAVSGGSGSFVVIATGRLQMTKLMLAIWSEYAWAGSGFNREPAIQSALNLLFDERTRAGMKVWSELIGDCRDAGNRTLSKLGELRAALELMGGMRGSGLLRGELAEFIKGFQNQ